jgi:copper transport protein
VHGNSARTGTRTPTRIALISALALLLATAGTAWAHPSLTRSEPPANAVLDEAPRQVRVWFDEAIESGHGNLSVYDGQGRRVDNIDTRYEPGPEPGLSVTLPGLPQGSYVVVWRVISQGDGHSVGGAFAFGVGVAPDLAAAAAAGAAAEWRPDLTSHLIRFVSLFAQTMFVGLVAFRSLVWRPALRRHLPEGQRGSLDREQRRFLQVVADVLVGALVMGLLGGLYAQARSTGVIFWELFGTRWGIIWLVRAAIVVLAAVWMEALLTGRRPAWLAWTLGLGLLLTTTLTSHSAARPGLLGPAADFAHQLAASVWLGGLAMLVLALITLRRSPLPEAARGRLAGEWVGRFSGLAAASVGLLLASGVVLAGQQVQSWSGLMLTRYGQALLVKLLVAGAALAFGAYNSLGIRRASSGEKAVEARHAPRVAAEAAVVLGAVFLAAVLTDLPPASATSGSSAALQQASVTLSARSAELDLQASLQPGRVGANAWQLSVSRAGQPLAGADVELYFQPVGGGGLAARLALDEAPGQPGLYAGTASSLTRQGPWHILVTVTPADAAPIYAYFDVDIGLDDVVRPAGSPLPLSVRAVSLLDQYGLALLSLAAFSLAAGWTWIVRRAVPGLQTAGWLASGLLLAAVVWSVLIAVSF